MSKRSNAQKSKSSAKEPPGVASKTKSQTLATVLSRLEQNAALSPVRRRDLISAVKRVADLLGQEPAAIRIDMPAISASLNSVNPVAVGISAKSLSNIRSDFTAAIRASGLMPVPLDKQQMSPTWVALFEHLSARRAHIGLSRLARYASGEGTEPKEIDDRVIDEFMAAIREGSLHRKPNALHRQVTKIWNEIVPNPDLGLTLLTVPSFREPPGRVAWESLPASFRNDVDNYLAWCAICDPFAPDARPRPLAPRTINLIRDQIHAAVTGLVESGMPVATIMSLAALVIPTNFKAILRHRLKSAGGGENTFNRDLGKALVQIARMWVKVEVAILEDLKRMVGKMPVAPAGLTDKNKRALRQFDDPAVLRRLAKLPTQLWAEVKRDPHPSFRTLAKAEAALAIAILFYMSLRLQNLTDLEFEKHLFLNSEIDAISSLEIPAGEMKNKTAIAFDVPPGLTKMLLEYRERIAPRIIGHRPTRLFVNVDGTPKSPSSVAWLIKTYADRHAGVELTPHQFRHLQAKVVLDDQPGAFELVKQSLGHKNLKTTVEAYTGIDSRRAARHHHRLIDRVLQSSDLPRRRRSTNRKRNGSEG